MWIVRLRRLKRPHSWFRARAPQRSGCVGHRLHYARPVMKRRDFIAALAASQAVGRVVSAQESPSTRSAAARPLTITLLGTGTPAPSLTGRAPAI